MFTGLVHEQGQKGVSGTGASSLSSPWKRYMYAFAVLGMFSAASYAAPYGDFAITVNPGPVAPNSTTVYPGEATSLRVTFSNNGISGKPLTNVNFNKALPGNANGGLRVMVP